MFSCLSLLFAIGLMILIVPSCSFSTCAWTNAWSIPTIRDHSHRPQWRHDFIPTTSFSQLSLYRGENEEHNDVTRQDRSMVTTEITNPIEGNASQRPRQRRSSNHRLTNKKTTKSIQQRQQKVSSVSFVSQPDLMLQHDILTLSQELELGQQVQTARTLQMKMKEFWEIRSPEPSQPPTTTIRQSRKRSIHNFTNKKSIVTKDYINEKERKKEEERDTVSSTWSQKVWLSNYYYDSDQEDEDWDDPSHLTIPSLSSSSSSQLEFDHDDTELFQFLGITGGHEEIRLILKRGALARRKLISSNVRLVSSIAKQWCLLNKRRNRASGGDGGSGRSTPTNNAISSTFYLDELIQEGILGLAKAVDRYDPQKQFRFGTYAHYYITNQIRIHYQQHLTGCLNVPPYFHQVAQRYFKYCSQARQRWQQQLLQQQQPQEKLKLKHDILLQVAEECNISTKHVKFILSLSRPVLSLDTPIYASQLFSGAGKAGSDIKGKMEMKANVLGHAVACTEPSPDEHVERILLRQCLEHAMSAELSPHERDVVRLRIGLDDGVPRTLPQLAKLFYGSGDDDDDEKYTTFSFGVAEIRGAEQRALKKLRSPYSMHARRLMCYLDIPQSQHQ